MMAGSKGGRFRLDTFEIINTLFMLMLAFITLYPFYYIIITSFNDATDLAKGGIYFWPRKLSFNNYILVMNEKSLTNAFFISVLRTVLGTVTSVFFTAAFAYGISKKHLIARKQIVTIMMITMYFNGGLIPYYLLIKGMGLRENFLVYIIPLLFNAFNAIIMMSFFRTVPAEIDESAKLDGANDLIIFIKLIIPISMPVIATIALYNGVAQWNSWFDAMLFGGKKLQTLQQLLVRLINTTSDSGGQAASLGISRTSSKSMRLATMVITALPIMMAYPFLQKYFVKGVMIGSIKG